MSDLLRIVRLGLFVGIALAALCGLWMLSLGPPQNVTWISHGGPLPLTTPQHLQFGRDGLDFIYFYNPIILPDAEHRIRFGAIFLPLAVVISFMLFSLCLKVLYRGTQQPR